MKMISRLCSMSEKPPKESWFWFSENKMVQLICFTLVTLFMGIISQTNGIPIDQEEQEAALYLQEIEEPLSAACYKETEAEFNYVCDMKQETAEMNLEVTKEGAKIKKDIQLELMKRFPNWKKFKNEDIRHQIDVIITSGPASMSIDEVQRMVIVQGEITKLRSETTICDFVDKEECDLRLTPDIQHRLKRSAKEGDMEAAEYYWTEIHNAIGKVVTPELFHEFVNLTNVYAKANGIDNTMLFWLGNFDDRSEGWTTDTFKNELKQLNAEFMPYYQKLHAYLRMKLKKSRGDDLKMPENGHIHNHIFGCTDEIGSDWGALASETMPFPDRKKVKFDEALKEANYTPRKIVEAAEQFFTGLNEEWKLPETVWQKSLIERPTDKKRAVSCHPVAYDFCRKNEYRLHMCIKVAESHLKLAYHELGHIFYYLQFQDLPYAFRSGANPGFHEAIGDAIELSITPRHMKCVLNLDMDAYRHIDCDNGEQVDTRPIDDDDINRLYAMALYKLPKLPFGLAVDEWRYKVFGGEIGPSEYNTMWWKIREELQGIVPSAPRPPEYLDAGTIFHVVANIPYVIYFTAIVYQYQFYEAMCVAAGQYDPTGEKHKAPLHRCDFANSKEAGKILKEMLEQGASKSWKDILEKFTGSREMSLRPLIDYYKPLFDYIDKELKDNNFPACFGKYCPVV